MLSVGFEFPKKEDVTFFAVTKDHIQLMHDGKDHWFLSFSVDGRVQVSTYKSQHCNKEMSQRPLQTASGPRREVDRCPSSSSKAIGW